MLVLGRRIGPIYLGEPRAKIEAAYGKGQRVTLRQGTANPVVTYYPAISIGVMYLGGHRKFAVILETSSPRYRTESGIGVGSGIGPLRKIGANCSVSPGSCGLPGGFGPPKHPTTATTFFLNHEPFPHAPPARVVRVVVAPLGG